MSSAWLGFDPYCVRFVLLLSRDPLAKYCLPVMVSACCAEQMQYTGLMMLSVEQLPGVAQQSPAVLASLESVSVRSGLSFPRTTGGDTTLSYAEAGALASSLHGATPMELQSAALGQSRLAVAGETVAQTCYLYQAPYKILIDLCRCSNVTTTEGFNNARVWIPWWPLHGQC